MNRTAGLIFLILASCQQSNDVAATNARMTELESRTGKLEQRVNQLERKVEEAASKPDPRPEPVAAPARFRMIGVSGEPMLYSTMEGCMEAKRGLEEQAQRNAEAGGGRLIATPWSCAPVGG